MTVSTLHSYLLGSSLFEKGMLTRHIIRVTLRLDFATVLEANREKRRERLLIADSLMSSTKGEFLCHPCHVIVIVWADGGPFLTVPTF